MKFIRSLVLTAFVSLSVACAGGEPAGGDDAALSDVDHADAASLDASDTDEAPDTQDTATDTQDVDNDPCGVCCPGERTCASEASIGVCAEDGSGFEEQACDDGQICEQGSCVAEPVCQEGETKCHDGVTRLVCRPGGTGWRTETCAGGESCLLGDCVSGEPNGAECAVAGDCAGGKCRCGSAETCQPAPSSTFCTAECTPGSCGPGEFCLDSQRLSRASYDHCVQTCDQTCGLESLSCVNLPTRDSGALAYTQGCYFDDTAGVGDECTSNDQCSTGFCLQGYYNSGICTYECSSACPTGTACVELTNSTFYCTPICGDGSVGGTDECHIGDGWDVTCAIRSDQAGNATRVCVAT